MGSLSLPPQVTVCPSLATVTLFCEIPSVTSVRRPPAICPILFPLSLTLSLSVMAQPSLYHISRVDHSICQRSGKARRQREPTSAISKWPKTATLVYTTKFPNPAITKHRFTGAWNSQGPVLIHPPASSHPTCSGISEYDLRMMSFFKCLGKAVIFPRGLTK